MESALKVTREELGTIQNRTIGDPVAQVYELLTAFQRDVDELVAGRPNDLQHGLMQNIRELKQVFRDEIFRGAPRFVPYPKSVGTVSHSEVQDTSNGLEPSYNAEGTVVYLDEVVERAQR